MRFPSSFTGYRWIICGLLFFATTINYLDRQVLSILAPTLQGELKWSEAEYGHIVFAFQLAYALSLVLSGRFIDKVGTRLGYGFFVALWSLVAMAHGLVRSTFGFGVVRFALGVTEAGNFPAAVKTVAEWFPKKERALATGLFNSGAMVGAIVAPLTVPWLTLNYGWQTTFVVLSGAGFVWLLLWWWLYGSPQQVKGLNPSELAHIQSDPPEPAMKSLHWLHLLKYRGVWAFAFGKFMTDPIWWFFLFWLAKFLSQHYGVKLNTLGAPLVVIYSLAMLGSVGGGWLAQLGIQLNGSLDRVRKAVMLLCALCVLPVFLAAGAGSLWPAVVLIGVALAGHSGWMANLFSLVSDLFPKQAVGSIIGIGGMAGAVGGMLIAEIAGWVLEKTGSYSPIFIFASGAYLFTWVVICILVPKIKPVEIR